MDRTDRERDRSGSAVGGDRPEQTRTLPVTAALYSGLDPTKRPHVDPLTLSIGGELREFIIVCHVCGDAFELPPETSVRFFVAWLVGHTTDKSIEKHHMAEGPLFSSIALGQHNG